MMDSEKHSGQAQNFMKGKDFYSDLCIEKYLFFRKQQLNLTSFLDFHKAFNIIICGTDTVAEKCFEEMHRCRRDVLAFIDINPQETNYLQRPVLSIEEASIAFPETDLVIFASSRTITPACNQYLSWLSLTKKLQKAFKAPVYYFLQMLMQHTIFEQNIKFFEQERLRNVKKFIFMHYTLGALPRIQDIDKQICAIYNVPDMRQNPDCYKEIYKDIPEYCNDYIKDVMYSPGFIKDDRGVPIRMEDRRTPYVNIVEGIRLTTDIPESFHNTVHILGPCMALGFGTDDKRTIASVLQRKLNENFPGWRVVNHSLIDHFHLEMYFPYILSRINFKDGDILIYFSYSNYLQYQKITDIYARKKTESVGAQYISMYNTLSEEALHKRLFVSSRHLSYIGMELYAHSMYDTIYETLKNTPVIQKASNTPHKIHKSSTIPKPQSDKIESCKNNPDLHRWILAAGRQRFPSDLYVGAVVMNCNPFTLGHRYLIEKALQYVNGLYIFVVEEDASYFSFQDRIKLVRYGVRDLSNVRIIPSGKFILSAQTFGEYFNKESPDSNLTSIDASTDVHIFGKYIAPLLNIKARFVGEEPLCAVTRHYNTMMIEILPQYGIDVHEITRLGIDGEPVSASQIRKYIEKLEREYVCETSQAKQPSDTRKIIFEELKKRLPASTLSYMHRRFFSGKP